MAKRQKERAPTPVTQDISPQLDPGNPEIESADAAAIDSALDDVLGSDDSSGGEATPPANAGTPADDATPEDTNDQKPPTGPRNPGAGETAPAGEGAPADAGQPAAGAEPKPQADPNAPPHDPEIDGIPEPRGLNPANQQNFKNLREVSRKYKTLANEYEAKVKELQTQVGQLPPEIQKELEENRAFRRTFDIANDKEFKDKYDKPSLEAEEEIISLMKKNGASDEHVKMLKEKGLINLPDKWWEDNVIKPLRESDNATENTEAIVIKQRLEKMRSLAYERQQEVQKASGSQSEFLKKRDEEFKQTQAADFAIMQKRIEEIQAQVPWARLQEIPKNATPEVKARIEAENKFYRETEERFATALYPPNAQARVETALAACLSFKLHQDLQAANAQIAQMKNELARFKGANVIKQSPTATVTPKPTLGKFDPKKNDSDAIDAAMQESGI